MSVSLNASLTAGAVISSDTSGSLALQTAGTSAVTINSSQVVTVVNDATIHGLTVGLGNSSVSTNTAVGASALNANTTGARNTALGNLALAGNTTTTYSDATAIGYNALYQGGGGKSTAIGSGALSSENGSGGTNVAVGYNALTSDNSGGSNVAVGVQALQANLSANSNTAVGYQAGYSVSTSPSNTFLGYQAGYSTTNASNTHLGFQAGYSATTGTNNLTAGSYAGYSLTTGTGNTFVGGSYNYGSGYYVTTGSKNTILGSYDGNQGGLDIRTSSNYIVLSDGDGNPRAYVDGNGKLTNPQGLGSFSQGNTYSLGTGSIAWSSIPDGVSIFSGSFTTVGTFQNIITGLDNASSYMLAMGKIGQTDLSSGSFCTFVNSTNLSFMGGTSSSIVQMSSNNFQMKCNSSSYGNNYTLTVIKGG